MAQPHLRLVHVQQASGRQNMAFGLSHTEGCVLLISATLNMLQFWWRVGQVVGECEGWCCLTWLAGYLMGSTASVWQYKPSDWV